MLDNEFAANTNPIQPHSPTFLHHHPMLRRSPVVELPEALVRDYADALVELAERYGISDIELYFIGPDCMAFQMGQPLQTFDNKQLGTLHVTAIHGLYHEQAKALSTPDSVIMFQPGFTVPDYDWSDSLKCIRDGTPFLLTSNTEMEAIAVSTPACGTHFRWQLAAGSC